MIYLGISPRVLEDLKNQFPQPANSAARALKKYVSLLEEQLNRCEVNGRNKWEIEKGIYYISLSKQRHKGGQIGPQKIRLQNWLDQNNLSLFKVVTLGSNLTEKLTQIKLSKLAVIERRDIVAIDPNTQKDDEIAVLLHDQKLTNKAFFEKLFPEIETLEQHEITEKYDFVPCDLKSLTNYKRWLEEGATKMAASRRLQLLNQIELITRVVQHTDGFFVQLKKPSQFGRVYYEGLSVQNVSKQLREAMLGKCYEYDLRSAVFSWKMLYAQDAVEIASLDQPVEKAFRFTISYLNDKKDYINTLRYLTFTHDSNVTKELQLKLIKQAMTAISFGARTQATGWKLENGEWQNSSIGEIFKSPEERERFVGCDLIREFVREQTLLDKAIIHAVSGEGREVFGDADVYTASGRLSRAKAIAFMYQSYETDLMNIVEELIKRQGKQVIARVHDAIYTKQKLTVDDRDEIQHYIRSQTDNPYWTFNHKEIDPFVYDSDLPIEHESVTQSTLGGWFGKIMGA